MEVAITFVKTALEAFSVLVGMVIYWHKMAPHALVYYFCFVESLDNIILSIQIDHY